MDPAARTEKAPPLPSPPSQGAEERRQSSASGHSLRSTTQPPLSPSQLFRMRTMSLAGEAGGEAGREVSIPIEEVPESADIPLSTMDVLQNFRGVISRNRDLEVEKAKHMRLEQYKAANQRQRPSLHQLMKYADNNNIRNIRDWVLYAVKYRHTSLPNDQRLIALARHSFPPRGELKVHVCDFGDNRAEHFEIALGEIERCWQEKPDWATVRWMHAPLGLGLTHSSVEDLFLHGGERGRAFVHGGKPGWPYIETEVLNFRSQQSVQEKRDVFMILSKLKGLKSQLDQISLSGDKNENLRHDIIWRAGHLGTTMGYWDLVESDMPWLLSEGMDMGQEPKDRVTPIGRDIGEQALSSHPFYRSSQLVRNVFRCFHRADGYLLTLSPATGVDYLDPNFSKYLEEPTECIFDNDDASAVGHLFQVFAKSGTSTWHRKTVEWFLVYLITEVAVTPHNYRQGHSAISVLNAYRAVVQDLKRRRYDPFKRNESVKLVREYLTCIDELTTISLILAKKIQMFEGLLQDCVKFETDDGAPDNPSGKSVTERVVWATAILKEQHDSFKRLVSDLRLSMDALFQLRSIEQNELAIVADSQNKAILLFTGVTIIFLPLSFFTSYYGMNLQGVVNTTKTETYFWKVCGTIGILIIFFVVMFVFRHRLLLSPMPRPRSLRS